MARLVAVEQATARVLSEASTVAEAAPRILAAICDGLGWDVGEWWVVDRTAEVLRCMETRHRPAVTMPEFQALSRRITFAPGVGLPGRVWAQAEPVWINDVAVASNFPRAAAALREGLHAAFSVPIHLGAEILGVVAFFSREIREPDAALLAMMATIGRQIGQFVERNRTEQAGRENEARQRAFLDSTLDGIIGVDHEGRITEFNSAAELTFGYRRDEVVGRELAAVIIPPGSRERHREGFRRYLETGEDALVGRRLETQGLRADGTAFPMELTITRLPSDGPAMFTGCVRDLSERHRTEASQRFQALLLDTVGEAVIATDPDGTIRFWNRFAEALYGWPAAEVLGRNIADVTIPPDSRERGAAIMETLRRGERWTGEFLVRRRDETTFLALVTDTPIVDSEGVLVGVVGVSSDITERKRIEAALAERTRQLEAVRMVSEEIARELNLTRLLRLITRRAAELVGAASGVVWLREPIGQGFLPWAWHGVGDWVGEARHTPGEGVLGEAARRREGFIVNDLAGSLFAGVGPERLLIERGAVARVLAEPLLYREALVGVITVYADGTGRPFADQDRALLALFADQAAVAIENARLYAEAARERRAAQVIAELARTINASLDLRTILERVAEAARELCEADLARIAVREESSGTMLLRYWTGNRWQGYHDALRVDPGKGSGGRVLDTGRPFRTDNYAADPRITKDHIAGVTEEGVLAQMVVPIRRDARIEGLLYVDRRSSRAFTDWEEATLSALADHAAVAIGNFRLLTRAEAARTEAETANRLKDEFLATLSHELRTPLNAVLGWVRLLATGGLDTGAAIRGLEAIERNARLQSQLIDDLLDVSRIITGKIRLEVRTLELADVVRAAIETVRPAVGAKHVHLEIAFDPSVGPVAGDAQRLQQVAWNLLSNAVKFTPAGGRIEVRLARVGMRVDLSVRDTGQGIAPEFLPHVFDRFRQADSTTTRVYGGLGLGLAIVRHLVELHGGSVRADSPGPGQGATFTVTLPLADVRLPGKTGAGPGLERPAVDPARLLESLHVLVVDDEADQRDLLATALAGFGAQVAVAGSAAAALAQVAETRPDLLVCDIGMPGQDGFALVRELRSQGMNGLPPAVALTAYARPEDRDAAMGAGFAEHLAKPVDLTVLAKVLARLAHRPAA